MNARDPDADPAPARAQRLDALADAASLRAPPDAAGLSIVGACALLPGRPGCIARAEGPGAADALERSRAAAVVTTAALAPGARVPALISDEPKLAFARMLALFEPAPPAAGVHASAVIADDARVDASATIGPHVVIGAGCALGPGTVIGANSVLGAGARLGPQCRIAANVSLGDGVELGARVAVEANAAIGGRGFGLVHDGAAWQPIPQLGCVRIEDDAEIGAGTTIDRGALDDTVIGRGVKIDDQVHIGHNCVIGAHTVIAGCTGIAGSCTIGAGCMIGGGVGIGDHVTLADGVVLTAASQVPANIDCSGVYSSTFRAMPARIWRKRLALFRQLDRIDSRLRGLEKARENKR